MLNTSSQRKCPENCDTSQSDRILSIIAHDLRAPISTIKMINAMIEEKIDEIKDPELVRLFEMINSTTEEAFHLLENLLRWSRSKNGTYQVKNREFNLGDAIRQTVSLFIAGSQAKDIQLIYQPSETILLDTDEDMVRTIVRNMISNALKFTHPQGKILVNVKNQKSTVDISVKDNGIGMDEETQQRIRLHQEYRSYQGTKNERGSGLGLLLCYEFAELLGGRFWFTSHINKGTTFHLSLLR